jgi:HEPN domain-containing protein
MREPEHARWLEQSKWDLKAARDSAAAENFEWACFQAQQAAGKALKAFLLGAGRARVISHSVRRLLVACEELEPRFAEVKSAAELDRYYVATRYPNGLPDDVPHEHFTVEAADRCQSLASSVIELVTRLHES